MGRHTTILPNAPFGRLLMSHGAKRVSREAMAVFSEIMVEHAENISKKAAEIAIHSKRKTIHDTDVRIASKS